MSPSTPETLNRSIPTLTQFDPAMSAVSATSAPNGSSAGNASYAGVNNAYLADRLAARTMDNSVPYLIPILDALPPAFTLLDVGCGPGSITIDIARRYPAATVLGVDGPDVVERAAAAARSAGVSNVRFAVGDGLDLAAAAAQPGFEAVLGGCDVAHTHQVHSHVQDPSRLMRELRAAARPHGGLVCCREGDHGMMACWPEKPAMTQYIAAIVPMLRARGMDPYAGRKLVSAALAAGFRREDIETNVETWVFSTPDERQAWAEVMVGSIKHGLRSGGAAQGQALGQGRDLVAALKAWDEWVEAEDGWYAQPCVQVVCRRTD